MKRFVICLFLTFIAVIALALPSSAATINLTIVLTENQGNSYSSYPFSITMDNTQFTSNGLDVELKDGETDLPAMVASDRTNYVADLSAHSSKQIQYTTGNTPGTSMPIIVGHAGYITTPDDATLEPGNNFELDISASFDTSAGENKNISYKEHALKIYVSANATIRTAFLDSSDAETVTLTSENVTPGVHILKIWGDGTDLHMQIDEGLAVTTSLGEGVQDSEYDWVWDMNDVMPYINYIKLSVAR
jgi:hypothetical protein